MSYKSRLLVPAFAASVLLVSRLSAAETPAESSWLGVGDHIPAATVLTAEGKPFDLNASVAAQPTVLIFYRGGWCPYCNAHLSALIDIEDDLKAAGFQLLAISPDTPEKLYDAPRRERTPTYILLSDADTKVIDAFGLGFDRGGNRLPSRLPHPAVYVVTTDGTIQFAHVDPNYRARLEPEKIVAAAQKVAAMSQAQN